MKTLNNSHTSNTDTYNEKERIKKLKKISGSLRVYISNIPGGEKNKFYKMLEGNMDESALFEFLKIPFPVQEEPEQVALSASPVASPLLADKTTLLQTLSHQMLKEKLKSINDGNSSPVSEADSYSASSTSSSSGSSTSSSSGSSSASVSSRLSSDNDTGPAPSQDDDDSAQSSVSDDTEGYESSDVSYISSSEDEDGVSVKDNNLGPNKFQELSQKILQGKLTSLNIGEPASLQGNQSPSSASSQSGSPRSSQSGSPRSSHTGSPRSSLPASTEANIQFNVWHQQLSQNSLQGKLTSLASNNLLGSQLPSPVGSPVESQPPIPVGSPVESQPSSQVGSPTGSLAKSPTGSRSSSLTGSPAGSRSGSPAESLQSEQITPQRGVKNSSDEPYLFKKYNDDTNEEYAIYYKDDNPDQDDNPDVNIANIKTDKCFNYFIYKKDDNIIIKPVKNYYSLTDILTIIYDEFQYIIIISKNTEKLYPGVLYQYKDYNKINLIFIYDNFNLNIIDDNFFDDTTNTEDGSFPIIPIGDDEYYQIKNNIYPDRQDTKSLSNISSALLRFKIKSIQRTQ